MKTKPCFSHPNFFPLPSLHPFGVHLLPPFVFFTSPACLCSTTDEINLRLSSIAQRMTMALQLIPIQKAKVSDARLQQLSHLQGEIRCAQFAAARAAEQQSAQLKRLMDQSKVDASKTQEMLSQVGGSGDLTNCRQHCMQASVQSHHSESTSRENAIPQML
jgi:hypothetical protein